MNEYTEDYERQLRCKQIKKELNTPLFKRQGVLLSSLAALLAIFSFAIIIVDKTIGLSAERKAVLAKIDYAEALELKKAAHEKVKVIEKEIELQKQKELDLNNQIRSLEGKMEQDKEVDQQKEETLNELEDKIRKAENKETELNLKIASLTGNSETIIKKLQADKKKFSEQIYSLTKKLQEAEKKPTTVSTYKSEKKTFKRKEIKPFWDALKIKLTNVGSIQVNADVAYKFNDGDKWIPNYNIKPGFGVAKVNNNKMYVMMVRSAIRGSRDTQSAELEVFQFELAQKQ
jgi:predicted RNase H-like nuclease (RuvC/YqgF family)